MPTPQDEEFLRFAIASGQLSQERAAGVASALREVDELGGSATAPELLLNQGVLDQAQIDRIHQAIASSKAATKVPRDLGGFELLEKIGQGGMGSVFKARQKELDRVVALKILSPRLARNQEFVERFLKEARSAGRLNHPNIVAAIDVGEDQGFYYFAMEYVDGETLTAMLAREGRLAEPRALAVATDVARALDHAHHKGLIHRDIKPDNIMVTQDGRVRVTDFGLARALDAEAGAAPEDRFLGTPAYVAPEQVRCEPDIDCRADLFSLGVTLFQMLTGELPFHGANAMAVAAAVLTEPLPPLRKLRPEASPAASRAVERLTAKDRGERPATPADAIAALERAAAAPPRPRPKPRPRARVAARAAPARRAAARRRRTPAAAYVAIGLAAAALAAAIVYLVAAARKRPPRSQPPRVVAPPTPERPPPTPTVDTAAAVVASLREAIEEAQQFARRKPKAYVSQIARWRKLHDTFARGRHQLPPEGAALFHKAASELKRLEAQARRLAEAELGSLRARIDARLKQGKLAEALEAARSFPPELTTAAIAPRLERLRAATRRRAVAEFARLGAQAQQLARQGHYEKAKAIYLAAQGCGIPEIASRAQEAIAAIDKLAAQRGSEAERAARRAYVTIAKAVLDHLAARHYAAARKVLDAAIVDPKLAPVAERLRTMQPLTRAGAEVWARVAAGVRQLKPGDRVRAAGVGGKFLRLEGDKLYFQAGGATMARGLTDLRPEEAVAFARRGFGTKGHGEVTLALFLLADRRYDDARKQLDAAAAKGGDVAPARDLVERFAPRTCTACKGAGTVPCPTCGGKGITGVERKPCDACDGKGSFPCTKCRGVGILTCPICRGTGEVFKGIQCGTCGGRGKIRCPRCKGSGEIKCKKCRGTGVLARPIVCARCKGRKTIPCPQCEGKGHFAPPDLVLPPEPK